MEIAVDTGHDITQLFKIISTNIKSNDINATCFIENLIIVSFENMKVKRIVSRKIAEFILSEFEEEIAISIIKPFELLKKDTDKILRLLSEDNELKMKRINLIEKEIYSFLSYRHINIDGIVKFRLVEYKKELKFTLELLIDELMEKKSYDEFIGLMKYFTEIQTPVTDTVVISEKSGEYLLTDPQGNPINLKFDEEFADEFMPLNLSGEDLLISNLMAAMPGKIIYNNIDTDKPIINTISRIFEGRIIH